MSLPPSIDLSNVEQRILSRIESLLQSPLWEDYLAGNWTKAVNKILIEIGKENHAVYCSDNKDGIHGEWLWDIVWSKEPNKDWKLFQGLELICEVEWYNGDHLLEDFQKLMVGLANHRLFIIEHYEGKAGADFNDYVKVCYEATQLAKNNFRYCIISLPWYDKKNLKYFAWIA